MIGYCCCKSDSNFAKRNSVSAENEFNIPSCLNVVVSQTMAGVVGVMGDSVTDIVEETLSSSTSRFSSLTALHVAPGRAVFAAYDRLLDNRTVAVKCRLCSLDRSDRCCF